MKFNLKNLDFNKKVTIVVLSVVFVFSVFFLHMLLKKNVVKHTEDNTEEVRKKPTFKEQNEDKAGFKELMEANGGEKEFYLIPFKNLIDTKNGKFLAVFARSDTDMMDDFYFKMIDGDKETELKKGIAEELYFTLEGKLPAGDFIIEATSTKDSNDVRKFKFERSKAVEMDLTNATHENFEKFQKARNDLKAAEARVTAASEWVSEYESDLKFLDEKIASYKKKSGEDYEDLVKRLEWDRNRTSKKIEKYKKQKADAEHEVSTIKVGIQNYESDFTKIFENLYTFHSHGHSHGDGDGHDGHDHDEHDHDEHDGHNH